MSKFIPLRAIARMPEIEDFYLQALRKIPLYQDLECLEICKMTTRDIRFLVKDVIKSRLTRALQLQEEFIKKEIHPFEPVLMKSRQGYRLISPPVCEVAEFASINDGSHRLYSANFASLESISCVRIEAQMLPPPASDSYTWSDVNVVDFVRSSRERTTNFQQNYFRPVVKVSKDLASVEIEKPEMWKCTIKYIRDFDL